MFEVRLTHGERADDFMLENVFWNGHVLKESYSFEIAG